MVERGEWGTAWGILLKLIFCARDTNRQLNSPTNSERRKPERSSHPAILKKIKSISRKKIMRILRFIFQIIKMICEGFWFIIGGWIYIFKEAWAKSKKPVGREKHIED